MALPAPATTRPDRYPKAARLFHWLMAAMIIAAWCIGFFDVHFRGNLPRAPLVMAHKGLASAVIFVAVARLIYRWRARRAYPPLPEGTSPAQALAAHTVHGLLYALAMIAAPMTGWFWSSVAGKPILMFGLIPVPPIAAADPGLYELARSLHVAVVWSAGALIALHLLAVIKHQVLDRDGVLGRMLR